MLPSTAPICRLLEWDTQFFGVRIAQVTSPSLTEATAQSAMDWCHAQNIACLYYLVPCGEIESIRLAQAFGFRLVDVRLTFELNVPQPPLHSASPSIRQAGDADIPALREIARQTYRNTRFFNDGHFPLSKCEELYMTWIEKSCHGYAETVGVADSTDQPTGFITCHLKNGTGQIGLLGVHPKHLHQGWGRQLLQWALDWYADHDCRAVRVVTQGSNRSAQQLYERSGFCLASVELWYHRWFNANQGGG